MSEQFSLEFFVGEHELSGVDMNSEEIAHLFVNAATVTFVLDGVTYTAAEDPDDDYRSALGSLVKSGAEVKNKFAPQRVVCSLDLCHAEALVMRDVVTGKTVLTIGTDYTDDYYPSFVGHFEPENMACNAHSVSE